MMYLKNVSTLELNVENCTGCGRCIDVCPHNVFEMADRTVRVLSYDRCMECGACMMNCAFGALTVSKGVGCASAIIIGAIRGTEPVCGCCDDDEGTVSGPGCCC